LPADFAERRNDAKHISTGKLKKALTAVAESNNFPPIHQIRPKSISNECAGNHKPFISKYLTLKLSIAPATLNLLCFKCPFPIVRNQKFKPSLKSRSRLFQIYFRFISALKMLRSGFNKSGSIF